MSCTAVYGITIQPSFMTFSWIATLSNRTLHLDDDAADKDSDDEDDKESSIIFELGVFCAAGNPVTKSNIDSRGSRRYTATVDIHLEDSDDADKKVSTDKDDKDPSIDFEFVVVVVRPAGDLATKSNRDSRGSRRHTATVDMHLDDGSDVKDSNEIDGKESDDADDKGSSTVFEFAVVRVAGDTAIKSNRDSRGCRRYKATVDIILDVLSTLSCLSWVVPS